MKELLLVFQVAGGLGLFLYGMKMMSDGLENMAGNRLSAILERATSNRFLGVLVGIGITCVVQSSTAATVMVVGFVNASLMTLAQAVGVIMGVNVGTSITTQIISFKIDQIAPLFIFIGAVFFLMLKKRSLKNLGVVLLGFGALLLGFTMMGDPLKAFASQPGFQSILTAFQNPLLALLAGIVFTVVIQSSTATLSILFALLGSGVELPFMMVVFLVLGSNIGTCFTTLLVSISASRDSKRAALVHLLFSVIGCGVFAPLIGFFPSCLHWIQQLWPDPARQVAMFHTMFNIATLLLLLPFVKQLTRLVQKIVPERPNEDAQAKRLLYYDSHALKTNGPDYAIAQIHREICRMGRMACDNLQQASDAFFAKNSDLALSVRENEKTINFLNGEISAWLARMRSSELSEEILEKTEIMLHVVSSVERIGDYADNVAEYTLNEEKYDSKLSASAVAELREMTEAALEINTLALAIFKAYDTQRLPEMEAQKARVNSLASECKQKHLQRLKDKLCDPRGGMVYTDMIIDLKHCSNHATYIAYSILSERVWDDSGEEFDE